VPSAIATAFGLAVRYSFTPVVALGFHRDAAGGGVEPNMSWSDPAQRSAAEQVATEIARRFKPRFLALGIEVNRVPGGIRRKCRLSLSFLRARRPRLPLHRTLGAAGSRVRQTVAADSEIRS
jgi:hypothetical protein